MVPTCLDNLIGVDCNVDKPTSGKFITDLFGINIRYGAAITDQQQSGIKFLKEKIKFATDLVLADLHEYLWPYFRVHSLIDEILAGDFSSTWIAPAAVERGMRIQTHDARLLRIRVNSIELYVQEVNTSVIVKILDGIYETEYTGQTDADGMLVLTPNYLSKTPEIFIVVDNTALNTNNTTLKNGCGCSSRATGHIHAAGWNGTGVVNTTYGLRVQAVGECSMEEIGCILGPRLELPVLYRSGVEVVLAAKTTDRLNSLTMLTDEKAQVMFEQFTESYQRYFKTLASSIPELMKRIDDCCLVCNQSRWVEGRP